jgi:streptogramin lyase
MLADAKIPGSDAIGKTYVVSGGQSAVWSSDFSAGVLQALESLL